jgi:dTDP-3,4-didehydro-2,6-dideoxy-alpha-D-glucose 3-reductase
MNPEPSPQPPQPSPQHPLRVGVMGCSSFARRAMIPALRECDAAELVCVASRSREKGDEVAAEFGCESVHGYDALLTRNDLNALYMPLPTGLHDEWCTRALEAGFHLLVEKSFAETLESAERMIAIAGERNLLVFENFQFQTHSQWKTILGFMTSGELGDVHLVRSTFGFPPLPKDNFRWNRDLGGGALLDAGAYMCKVSQLLLGAGCEVLGSSLQFDEETGVDKYGEAMLRNAEGRVAQVAFGFDYFYQCRVELLGTKGKLSTNRVFTAKPDNQPLFIVETQEGVEKLTLPADDAYRNMWQWFAEEIVEGDYAPHWDVLRDQARLMDEIRLLGSGL